MEVSSNPQSTPDNEPIVDEKLPQSQNGSQIETQNEPTPRIHAATFLAVGAICLIYFSQTFVLVGTGSVSAKMKKRRKVLGTETGMSTKANSLNHCSKDTQSPPTSTPLKTPSGSHPASPSLASFSARSCPRPQTTGAASGSSYSRASSASLDASSQLALTASLCS